MKHIENENREKVKDEVVERERESKAKDNNLKSGMPLAVLIPAPATTTTFLQRPSFISRATEARPPRDGNLAADTDGRFCTAVDPED